MVTELGLLLAVAAGAAPVGAAVVGAGQGGGADHARQPHGRRLPRAHAARHRAAVQEVGGYEHDGNSKEEEEDWPLQRADGRYPSRLCCAAAGAVVLRVDDVLSSGTGRGWCWTRPTSTSCTTAHDTPPFVQRSAWQEAQPVGLSEPLTVPFKLTDDGFWGRVGYPGIIHIFSFSKSFGMAGWRVGYLVYPRSLHGAMRSLQDTIPTHAVMAAQQVALAALDDTDGQGGVQVGRPGPLPRQGCGLTAGVVHAVAVGEAAGVGSAGLSRAHVVRARPLGPWHRAHRRSLLLPAAAAVARLRGRCRAGAGHMCQGARHARQVWTAALT